MADAPRGQLLMQTRMRGHGRENGRGPWTVVNLNRRYDVLTDAQVAALSDAGRRNRTAYDRGWDSDTCRLTQFVLNSEVGDGDQ
jgi:hypothetical protein